MTGATVVIGSVLELADAVLSLAIRLQEASNVLKKAHAEGWTEDDPRWDEAWKTADQSFEDALSNFKK